MEMSSSSIGGISTCTGWWLDDVASSYGGMEDENLCESSDMPSLREWEPDLWCDVPGEKIFFNPWDNFIPKKTHKNNKHKQEYLAP
jgi:hypothetical protein